MPFIFILRFLFTLLSLVILGVAAYLLWTWYQGEEVRDLDGFERIAREDWRLWTGLALLAWSLLGRVLLVPLLAKGDTEPMRDERARSTIIDGWQGSKLYVESHGPAEAPTIVLTHGWSLDSTIWLYTRRDLSKRFRIITWDLPGMGRSTAGSSASIELEAFAKDLRAVIVFAGDKQVVVVGHSIGGMTIQTLARDNPAFFNRHVAGVVLLNTTYTNPLRTMILSGLAQALRWPVLEPMMHLTRALQPLAWLSAWQSYFSGSAHLANRFGFGRYVTRSQLNHTALLGTRNPPGNIAKGNLAMFNWDATGALSRTEVPVLVIGGDADIVTKPDASRDIARQAQRAQLQIVQGVNHMGFLERADVYNRAIEEFAASVQSQAE